MMDKGHLLVYPKLDHTYKELTKALLGCQKINGINPQDLPLDNNNISFLSTPSDTVKFERVAERGTLHIHMQFWSVGF